MKKPLNIDRPKLEAILLKLEAAKEYSNRSSLYLDASSVYLSECKLSVSPAVIYLRVKEWGTVLATPVGKRGGNNGPKIAGQRTTRATKLNGNKSLIALRARWTKDKGAKPFMKLLDKVEKGSLKASIKANCIDCANFQRDEVKYCQVVDCVFHSIRPYQQAKGLIEETT